MASYQAVHSDAAIQLNLFASVAPPLPPLPLLHEVSELRRMEPRSEPIIKERNDDQKLMEVDVILTTMTQGVTFMKKVGSVSVSECAGEQYYNVMELAREHFTKQTFSMRVRRGCLFPHYAAGPDGTTLHLGNLEREQAMAAA